MLIAEELEVDLKQVSVEHAPPNEKLYGNPLLGGIQATGNSNAIRAAWQPLRQAGATARTMLVAAAAKQWKVDPASCRAQSGEVLRAPTGRRITTFSVLRNAPAKAGDLVAVLGIGGLGHLGVQYARHIGFEVAAIGRGADKAEFAKKLGAHHYVDSSSIDPGMALQKLCGAALVIVTASGGKTAAQTMRGLRPRGRIIALGATPDPVEVSTTDLLFGNRSIEGAITGDPATGDATLRFSALTGIAGMIETMPLEKAPEAYAKMMAGKARFRMVITM
jgi:D-arabinose 1-dehydrogenase-like Zn-dependent alcohol dehydrogenase